MTAFSDWYGKNIYKANAQERVEEINFLLAQIATDMERTADPTQWNRLLDRADMLRMEQKELADSVIRINNG